MVEFETVMMIYSMITCSILALKFLFIAIFKNKRKVISFIFNLPVIICTNYLAFNQREVIFNPVMSFSYWIIALLIFMHVYFIYELYVLIKDHQLS